MEEYMKKNNYGITLIALAVTIIIMLILAGVTISALTGNSGITTQAKHSKTKNELMRKVYFLEKIHWDIILKMKMKLEQ